MTLEVKELTRLFERMLLIRQFEELSEKLYKAGKIGGSIHLGIGQEAIAVGVCDVLTDSDRIVATYRCRPQSIAKGADPARVLAEMLGKATGVCGGLGGPMHITDIAHGILPANAIVGAGVPIAAGVALAAQIDQRADIAVAFFGEGATNQGVVLETMNMAALWKLPLLLLCENNVYAEMTPFHESVALNDLGRRAEGFGIPAVRIDGNDIEAVRAAADNAVRSIRGGGGPIFLEADTYRFSGHMVGDQNMYRTKEEMDRARLRDPLLLAEQRLRNEHHFDDAAMDEIRDRVGQEINRTTDFAESSERPTLSSALEVTYA